MNNNNIKKNNFSFSKVLTIAIKKITITTNDNMIIIDK